MTPLFNLSVGERQHKRQTSKFLLKTRRKVYRKFGGCLPVFSARSTDVKTADDRPTERRTGETKNLQKGRHCRFADTTLPFYRYVWNYRLHRSPKRH